MHICFCRIILRIRNCLSCLWSFHVEEKVMQVVAKSERKICIAEKDMYRLASVASGEAK